MSRSGKHKRGKVRMGVYVEPFRKAVTILAARECNMSMTDVIWSGIESVAKTYGILDANGRITPQFENQLHAVTETVKCSEVNS